MSWAYLVPPPIKRIKRPWSYGEGQALREQLRDLKAAREGVLTWACHTAEVELQYRRKITEDKAVLEKLRHQVENPPE